MARCCSREAGGSDDLSGKVVIVTGASDGIGLHTAEALANRNARVIMACRSLEKSNAVAQKIRANTQSDNVVVMKLDLSSLASVKSFSDEFHRKETRLDILINNAGINPPGFSLTEDGIQSVFQVNHIGHFLLTHLLKDMLVASAPSRVVNVASRMHKFGNVDMKTFNEQETFSSMDAYSNSKLANILFTLELAERWKEHGVTAYALCPGFVTTNISSDLGKCTRCCIGCFRFLFAKTPSQGAQTSIYCAVESDIEQHSGKYFQECRVVNQMPARATDRSVSLELWDGSMDLVKEHLSVNVP